MSKNDPRLLEGVVPAVTVESTGCPAEKQVAIPAESEEEVRRRFANWNLVQRLMEQEQLDEWEDYVRHCKGAPISSIRPWDSSSLGGNDQVELPSPAKNHE